MARSHVKELVRQGLGLTEVVEDCDGDLPFRQGSAAWFISTREDGQRLRVWSRAVLGIKATAAVLREVNDANLSLEVARVVVRGQAVFVEGVLPVEDCSPERLELLCREVSMCADGLGQLLVAVHGGSTWFDDVGAAGEGACPECGSD